MAEQPQSFANHTRWVPAFHFVTFGILGLNLLWRIFYVYRMHGALSRTMEADAWANIFLAVALVLLALYARLFALKVQDRVIRAEERERLTRLLPADWRPRVAELSAGQLVALRFASDEEVAALAQKVLTDRITDRKAIKQMVRTWRADHLRA